MKTKALLSAITVGLGIFAGSSVALAGSALPNLLGQFNLVKSNSSTLNAGRSEVSGPGFNIPGQGEILQKVVETHSVTLQFRGMGRDWNSLETEFVYSSPYMSQLLLSGNAQLRLRSTWGKLSCDGQSIQAGISKYSDLESAVRALRSLEFSQYMSCQLESQNNPISSEPTVTAYSNYYSNQKLVFMENGEIQYLNSNYAARYASAAPTDETQRRVFAGATSQMVSIIQSYGVLMASLAKEKAPAKSIAANAWMAKNKYSLLENIEAVERSMSGVSTMEKLSAMLAIRSAFDYVAYIEMQSSSPITLGEVVRFR